MKNFFFNEDGTVKIPNTIGVIAAVLVVGVFLVVLLMGTKGDLANGKVTTTQKIGTTTIKLCNGCSLKFKETSYTMPSNTSIDLQDLLNIKKVNIKNVKITIEDKEIVMIEDKGKTLNLTSLDVLGSTKVTVEYEKLKTEIEIIVDQDYINSAKLYDKVYYAYVGETTELDLDVSPKGAETSSLDLSVLDKNIADFDESGKLVGKSVGETTIYLKDKDEVSSASLFVVDNRLTFKVKEDVLYKEMDEYHYLSNVNGYIEVSLKFEDRAGVGYTVNDIKSSVVNVGNIKADVVAYGANEADHTIANYRINISIDNTVVADENYAIIYMMLPDGSKTRLKIVK